MKKETVTLNTQEQQRVLILNRIQSGQLSVGQAAPLLGVSERHVRRILAAYREEGVAARAHGNRGRQPSRTIPQDVRSQVLTLARTTYVGCSVSHLRDLLAEREQLVLSRSSVRRILLSGGLIDGHSRKASKHRRRRTRYPQEGLLVQIDGSPHAWLEERGPRLSLLAAIDDATGKIVAAIFRQQEDAAGYFLLVQQLLERCGRPAALYHDRHSTFAPTKPTTRAERVAVQLAGKDEQHLDTHFGRLLQELEIRSITARSPQAKGRVERLFGTLQQRLVVELRLAKVASQEEANAFLHEYLPRFNAQFAVPAAQPGTAYRSVEPGFEPERVFCFKYLRTVAADNTVRFAGQRLQLLPSAERRSYAQAQVEVHERLDGSLAVVYVGRVVVTTPAPAEAPLLRARAATRVGSPSAGTEPTPDAEGTLLAQAGPSASGESTASPARTAAPASAHPWRKPGVFKRRTFSLDT